MSVNPTLNLPEKQFKIEIEDFEIDIIYDQPFINPLRTMSPSTPPSCNSTEIKMNPGVSLDDTDEQRASSPLTALSVSQTHLQSEDELTKTYINSYLNRIKLEQHKANYYRRKFLNTSRTNARRKKKILSLKRICLDLKRKLTNSQLQLQITE